MAQKRKKQRKSRGALAGIIMSIYADNPFRAYNYKQISNLLGLKDKASRDLLMTILGELTLAGELNEPADPKDLISETMVCQSE